MNGFRMRMARAADAPAIAAIYAPIVEGTIISFEEVAPSADEMRSRIEAIAGTYPWLVAERAGGVLGYAYASLHNERAGYRWSVNVSAYVDAAARRQRVASSLYRALFRVLEAQGFHRAFAGITLPNDASVGLHRSLGFELVGVYPEVGFKLGAWHDTSWWHRSVGTSKIAAEEPVASYRLAPAVLVAAGIDTQTRR
jgi:L-amino acid N-acyltransferase YncA